MQRRALVCAAVLLGLSAFVNSRADSASLGTECLSASGKAGRRCLDDYTAAIEKCRTRTDAGCEDAARAAGGALERSLNETEGPILRSCTDETADPLGYPSLDDVVLRIPEACTDFAEDLLDIGFSDDLDVLSARETKCQARVSKKLRRLRRSVVRQFGPKCFLPGFAGKSCNRTRRDSRVEKKRARIHRQLLARCGSDFDALGLSELGPGSTLEERIDEVLDRVIDRARHYAQRVYPPNNLRPNAEYGPHPVGVSTLSLTDAARSDVPGTGPRPVTTEVYYPSTAAAVAGVPEDVVSILGIPLFPVPAFRDVELASGPFPLVLFSHGNNGVRFQSFFFASHLASHGFIVVCPDHHGNTFTDNLQEIVDPEAPLNRPLDMSFLIDEFLAFNAEPGNFFEGAIEPSKIGASGHSFGGYTSFALAGGSFLAGTLTDTRVKAIFPQAPAASAFDEAFFSSITIPVLIVGGSIDETTPFPEHQQYPFDNLPSGAAVVGVAELIGGGHFSFSDFCEVPRDLLAFMGGFEEACEPRHLPWRHAQDIVKYLSLSFFDGILNGNGEALARLDPANLATVEDLVYQSK
jgi:predicted dienelactone hydrolase